MAPSVRRARGRGPQVSRRSFLQAAGAGGAALALAACDTGSEDGPADAAADALSWSNWPGYIDLDEDTGTSPTLQAFEKQSGQPVRYTEDINDNEEFYAKVRIPLEQGEPIGRDLVVLSEWMSSRWIRLGYAQEFSPGAVPGRANVLPRLVELAADPGLQHSVPWQAGFAGLGWNTELLKEATGKTTLTSLDELWSPELKGRVSVLSEMHDTIGLILLWQGKDPANFTDDDFAAANAELDKQIQNGQIRQVTGNDYLTSLESGDLIASMGWSGDVLALGEDFDFALPESGGTIWVDTCLIPAGAARKAEAESLLDYYCQPDVAAQVAAYVRYLCPIQGAQEAMRQVDPESADDPWIFPSAEVLAGASVFKTLTDEEQDRYNRVFQKTIGN